MKSETKTATAEKAYGKALAKPIDYTYTWENFESDTEFENKGTRLSVNEQRKVRELEAQSKARQAALTKALTDNGIIKPTLENDDQMKLREMFKVLMSSKKYSEARAREICSDTLGVAWADNKSDDDSDVTVN